MEFVRSRGGETGAPQVSETVPQLLDAATRLENHDDFSARETYLEALAAIMYAGRLGEPGALADAAEAACSAISRTPELPRPVDLLLKGMAERITGGVERRFHDAARRVGGHVQDGWVGRWPSATLDGACISNLAGGRRT